MKFSVATALPYEHLERATAALRAELRQRLLLYVDCPRTSVWDMFAVTGPHEFIDFRGRVWYEYRATVESGGPSTGERQITPADVHLDRAHSLRRYHRQVLARAPIVLLGPGAVGHPSAVVVAEAPGCLGAGLPAATVLDLDRSRRVEGALLEESDDGHHGLVLARIGLSAT